MKKKPSSFCGPVPKHNLVPRGPTLCALACAYPHGHAPLYTQHPHRTIGFVSPMNLSHWVKQQTFLIKKHFKSKQRQLVVQIYYITLCERFDGDISPLQGHWGASRGWSTPSDCVCVSASGLVREASSLWRGSLCMCVCVCECVGGTLALLFNELIYIFH